MKNRTLPLSLLIGAALTIPSLAMAAPTKIMPVNMQTATADNTLQTEVKSTDGGLASAQVSPFEINETKTFSRASMNNRNDKAGVGVATQIQTTQNPQRAMQNPQQDRQEPQQDMQNSQQNMQNSQQDMQESEEDMQDSQELM